MVYDAVRGATKDLYTSETDAEGTNANGVTSFNSDGFTVGSSGGVNGNTQNIVAWNWLGANTTVSNTSGSITSTVSANTTSGFSVVSYTGTGVNATIGHGLGVRPSFIIVKVRDTANAFTCQHISLGAGNRVNLSSTAASASAPTVWNSTEPTSSVFSVGTEDITNNNGNTYIAYCFAQVKGYSKFGSYTGNGSADGTFTYCGFSPAFIMIKRTDSADDWVIIDNRRTAFNSNSKFLYANVSDAEESLTGRFDFLSNGFKIRNSWTKINASGGTYIYIAFAENPFVSSTLIPVTAR